LDESSTESSSRLRFERNGVSGASSPGRGVRVNVGGLAYNSSSISSPRTCSGIHDCQFLIRCVTFAISLYRDSQT
jgi:hypothetical protein